MIRFTSTNRGKRCLVLDNFLFREYHIYVDGNIKWRCTNKNCSAKVVTSATGDQILEVSGVHNHEQCSDRKIQCHEIRAQCKKKTEEEVIQRPATVVRSALASMENSQVLQQDILAIKQGIHRTKRKTLPPNPGSRDEALQQLSVYPNVTNRNENFVHLHDDIVVLTCKSNLEFMCLQEIILADGTFYVAPKFFTQLYTIHAFKDNGYVPLVFAFLPSKTTECYTKMWNFVVNLCVQYGLLFIPIHCILDFEYAAHTAFLTVFPGSYLSCCSFHYGQAIYRKIQSLGLVEEYNGHTECGKFLKQFFGISYLPPDEVEEAFLYFVQTVPVDKRLADFLEYMAKTYIGPRSRFPPYLWASSPAYQPRTTNGAESFHRHLKDQFVSPHPSVHLVVEVLKKLQTETYVKCNALSVNAKKRKNQHDKEAKILQHWQQYTCDEISRTQYIKAVGYAKQVKGL